MRAFFAIIFEFVPVIHNHEKIWIQIWLQQIPRFGFARGKFKKKISMFFLEMSAR
jgi:hypothetical protein